MKHTHRTLPGLFVAGLLQVVPLAAQQNRTSMVRQADLIFVGTVTAVAATSVAGVPVTQRTLTVRVDAVLDKPATVSVAAGDTVTVEARTAGALAVGAQATFYTRAWLFGSGVAAQEVGHETVSARRSAAAMAPLRDSVLRVRSQVSDSTLRARIRAADMVVVGRVETVQAASLAAVPTPRRITEHDPSWQEAVIQVETMIKGALPADQRVVVRFPGSLDVAWRAMPKFTVGQEGTFLLRRDQLSGSPMAMMAGRQVTAYAAPTAQDVLTTQDAARVRALARP
jgi:plastocyanin